MDSKRRDDALIYLDPHEAHTFWKALEPLSQSGTLSEDLMARRRIDACALSTHEAAYASPTAAGLFPAWSEAMSRRVVTPLWIPGRKEPASFKHRNQKFGEGAKPKSLCLKGISTSSTVMANRVARRLLMYEETYPGCVVIVEGEPDFWTWCELANNKPIAVFGIHTKASWQDDVASCIPDVPVYIRTDPDGPGLKYAEKIGQSLPDHELWLLSGHTQDDNDSHKAGLLDENPSKGCTRYTPPPPKVEPQRKIHLVVDNTTNTVGSLNKKMYDVDGLTKRARQWRNGKADDITNAASGDAFDDMNIRAVIWGSYVEGNQSDFESVFAIESATKYIEDAVRKRASSKADERAHVASFRQGVEKGRRRPKPQPALYSTTKRGKAEDTPPPPKTTSSTDPDTSDAVSTALFAITDAKGDEETRHNALMEIGVVWHQVSDQPAFRNELVAALKHGGFKAPVRVAKFMIAELNAELSKRERPLVSDLWPDIAAPDGLRLPKGYKVDVDGSIHVQSIDKDGCIEWERITSDALIIAAQLADMSGSIKLRLMWRSRGRWKQFNINRGHALMARPLMERALDKGLPASSDTDTKVVRYLEAFEALNIHQLPQARTSSQMGWITESNQPILDNPRFLWGHTLLTKEDRITQDPSASHDTSQDAAVSFNAADDGNAQLCRALGSKGTMDGWIDAIRPLQQFPHAMFALYTSLASVLQEVLDHERTIIVDFAGPSGCGKTTAQRIAASCWGNTRESGKAVYMHSWDSTGVALERMAASYNHLPLILNDSNNSGTGKRLGADVKGKAIYQLSNSQGRARGRRGDHALGRKLMWNLCVISSGESKLIDHAASGYGGAKARVLQFHGSPFGSLEHGKLVTALQKRLAKNYGHAGPAFLQGVAQRMSPEWIKAQQDACETSLERLTDTHAVGRSASHVSRLSNDIAFIHVAASLAHEILPIPWAYDGAVEAIAGDLLAHAQDVNVNEVALRMVYDWCCTNAERFVGQREPDNNSNVLRAPPQGWAGAWKTPNTQTPWKTIDIIASVLDDVLERGGYRAKSIRDEWSRNGWLLKGGKGRTSRAIKAKVNDKWQNMRVVSLTRQAIEEICGFDPEDRKDKNPALDDDCPF